MTPLRKIEGIRDRFEITIDGQVIWTFETTREHASNHRTRNRLRWIRMRFQYLNPTKRISWTQTSYHESGRDLADVTKEELARREIGRLLDIQTRMLKVFTPTIFEPEWSQSKAYKLVQERIHQQVTIIQSCQR